jgi:hypothetical protein
MNKEVTNSDILEAINNFRKEVKDCYVSLDRYLPVEKLVYGMAGVVLLAVVGALVALVVTRTGIQAIQ